MDCWPANVVGVFFLVLLISDVYYLQYLDLPAHSLIGIMVTLFFWLICNVLGEYIAAAILIIPGIFFLFYLAIGFWASELINVAKPRPAFNRKKCRPPPRQDCPIIPPVDVCPISKDESCEDKCDDKSDGSDTSGNIIDGSIDETCKEKNFANGKAHIMPQKVDSNNCDIDYSVYMDRDRY